ncbi:MAG: hypothetical protein OXK80_01200 [Bdellovibrionales bacterium]|nr:hypothetical protein [Bdellovibrionales bacterium]
MKKNIKIKKISGQKLIQLSDSYNRSTNLELDFKDSSKLKNIYLSSKFQEGLKEIFVSILEKNSNHRVRVLSGSPGLGKSTFALLVAQVISKKYPKIINNLITKSDHILKTNFNSFQKSGKTKLLPVFINGYEGEIEQIFKNKLKEILSDNGVPIKNRTKDTLNFYKSSLDGLKTKGYSGIFVIYDEFGKYLEKGVHNPTDLNIQFLQNFAEFCNRSGEKQCHLMLITHLSISQYASQLPINVQQEWAKIEGRFQESAFYDKDADYYKMISAVFEKNISTTHPLTAKKYTTYIKKYLSNFKEDVLKGFIDLKNLQSILLNCFPLHPSVLALLPHLSKKIAQNERTLYTFLTRDENYSLKRFLEEQFKDHTTVLMPYDLYQYFKLLIGKDIGIGGTYKIQLMAEEAFKRIDQNNEASKQVISLMALCSVVKDAYFAPLTESFIASCFNQIFSKEDIKKCLKSLRDKKIIFYNKNTKQYLLQEGAPIDIDEEIVKLKNTALTSKNLVQVLKRYFKTDFIIPKKYNFDHAISRFYKTEIISVEELRNLKKKEIVDFYREDGCLFYVVPFSHDELIYAKSEIKTISSPLTVFVLPQQFIECKKDIEELNAVDCLYNNKEILSASPLVKKELDRHKEILLTSISSLLKPLIGYMNLSAYVVYPKPNFLKGTEAPLKVISHFKELQRYLGDLFEEEYNKYVSFNLEYMNRHSVSGSITLGRKKFVDILRLNKKEPVKDITNYVEGRGPDYVILDTVFRSSKFRYDSLTNTYQVSKKSKYYSFFKEYEQILSKHPQGIHGNTLLNILVSPPYGLRLGVIPVFIALADLCFKQPVSHYFEEAYVKELDGDHYDLLMKYPKKTIIHYTPINTKQQTFLNGLSESFKAQDVSIRSVIEALLKWRKSIPESTKLSSHLSQEGRKVLIQIDSSKEPDKLLFKRIPNCFNNSDICSKTSNNEIEDTLIKLNNIKKEIDNTYKNLLLKIKDDLVNCIKFISKQCLNNSIVSIPKDQLIKTFQNTLSQVKDYPFSSNTSRFIGRILNFDSSNYNQYFLETVADVLTGSSPRYWNEKGYSKFEFALKRIKTEIELASEIANPKYRGQSVLAFIDKGQQKKIFMKLGAVSHIDNNLIDSIEKIKMILNSFDEIDKRKIILAILESIDKKFVVAGDIDFINTNSKGKSEINA